MLFALVLTQHHMQATAGKTEHGQRHHQPQTTVPPVRATAPGTPAALAPLQDKQQKPADTHHQSQADQHRDHNQPQRVMALAQKVPVMKLREGPQADTAPGVVGGGQALAEYIDVELNAIGPIKTDPVHRQHAINETVLKIKIIQPCHIGDLRTVVTQQNARQRHCMQSLATHDGQAVGGIVIADGNIGGRTCFAPTFVRFRRAIERDLPLRTPGDVHQINLIHLSVAMPLQQTLRRYHGLRIRQRRQGNLLPAHIRRPDMRHQGMCQAADHPQCHGQCNDQGEPAVPAIQQRQHLQDILNNGIRNRHTRRVVRQG